MAQQFSGQRAQPNEDRHRSCMPDHEMRRLQEHALDLKRHQGQEDGQASQNRSESGGCKVRSSPRKQPEDYGCRKTFTNQPTEVNRDSSSR
jgi:hypothetical protein